MTYGKSLHDYVSLYNQECKWVPELRGKMGGPKINKNPIQGNRNILSHFEVRELQINAGLMSQEESPIPVHGRSYVMHMGRIMCTSSTQLNVRLSLL